MTVAKATSNNSAYRVTSPSFPLTLASGKSVKVTVLFAPKSAQRMIGTIAFSSNASDPTLDLALNGWGVSGTVAASPASIDFGSVASGNTESVFETLTESRNGPARNNFVGQHQWLGIRSHRNHPAFDPGARS